MSANGHPPGTRAEVAGRTIVISLHAARQWRRRCSPETPTRKAAERALEELLPVHGSLAKEPPESTRSAAGIATDAWLVISDSDAVFPLVEKDDGSLVATTCLVRRDRGMVGRVYTWNGRTWRVVARWRSLSVDDPVTHLAPCCGHLELDPRDWPDETLGDESYCGSCGAMWTESRPAGHQEINGWRPGGRPAIRNVLIEDVETGERVVRPFRGLRRLQEDGV